MLTMAMTAYLDTVVSYGRKLLITLATMAKYYKTFYGCNSFCTKQVNLSLLQ
jgi:hypothetical protein